MLTLLEYISTIIGNETDPQKALTLLVFGSIGLGIIGLCIRLISKIKAVAFLGG